MMTMTMMQRLLQSEERTQVNSSPNIDESDRKALFEPTSTLPVPYQITNRDNKELAVNYGNNNHHPLFFKSLASSISQEGLTSTEKNVKKAFIRVKNCSRSSNAGNYVQSAKENGYSEELVGRLSGESEDSTDVNNAFAEERISSEDDLNSAVKEEDVRSPVDLTSRRLPMSYCGDDGSEINNVDVTGTAVISCRHSVVCTSEENSTVDDAYMTSEKSTDVASTRRLAFSVENILDPNMFTGKQIEDGVKEKFSLPYSWRPHLDFINSPPVNVNRAGKLSFQTPK